MELIWLFVGVLVGMVAMYLSCYFSDVKPLRKELAEQVVIKKGYRQLADDWEITTEKALQGITSANNLTVRALLQRDAAYAALDALQAAKPVDNRVEWYLADYAKRMEGEGFGD